MNKEKLLSGINLKEVPKDVMTILVDEQAELKKTKDTRQFGLDKTIYKIVREWKRCQEDA